MGAREGQHCQTAYCGDHLSLNEGNINTASGFATASRWMVLGELEREAHSEASARNWVTRE